MEHYALKNSLRPHFPKSHGQLTPLFRTMGNCFCLTFSTLLKQDALCDVQYKVSCDNKVSVDCGKGRNIADIWNGKYKGLKRSGNGRKFSRTAASAD